MRIVHLSSVHARYDNRILLKQCVSLAKRKYQVYLIIADGKGDERFNGVNIIDVGSKKGLFHRVTKIVQKVYRAGLSLDGDIYELHDPELLPIGLKLKRRGKNVIYDVHEDYVTGLQQKKYLPKFIKKPLAFIWNKYEQYAASKLTVLLAEKYYAQRFPKGHLILNYPILPESLNDSLFKETEVSNSLIYSGNITEVRGAFTQSQLLNHISNINITFIGYCDNVLADRVLDKLPKVSNRLELIGRDKFIPFDKIVEKYNEKPWLSGLALFPKTKHYEKKELTKFFEYMTYGLPILCSDFPSWKSFVEDNECGIAVDPDNIEQIAKAINYLKNNPQIRRKMGNNGRKAIMEKFNWGNEERKLITIYNKLVNE